MTAAKPNPNIGAVLAVSILLAGWVASVVIRTWQHVEVELGVEMMTAAAAAGIVYTKMSGRSGPGSDDGTAS